MVSDEYQWTRDNYGPLWVPKAGTSITLTVENLPLYRRIITTYEGHTLDIEDGVFYIDGEETTTYTFGMNYYFMMGITGIIRWIRAIGALYRKTE